MDWGKFLNGLGSAGDILAGKESYNSALRGQQQNATANRQIDVGVQQNTENNELKKLLQQIQIAADTLSQEKEIGSRTNLLGMQQGFEGTQNRYKRAQEKELSQADIAAREKLAGIQNEGAMARELVPFRQKQQQLNDAGFYSPVPETLATQFKLPAGVTPAQLSVYGPAAVQAATMGDPMMTKQFGNSFTQMEELRQMNDLMQLLGRGGQRSASQGVRPTGTPAPRVSPFTPGK